MIPSENCQCLIAIQTDTISGEALGLLEEAKLDAKESKDDAKERVLGELGLQGDDRVMVTILNSPFLPLCGRAWTRGTFSSIPGATRARATKHVA